MPLLSPNNEPSTEITEQVHDLGGPFPLAAPADSNGAPRDYDDSQPFSRGADDFGSQSSDIGTPFGNGNNNATAPSISNDHDDERARIRQRDRMEREVERHRLRAQRLERRSERRTDATVYDSERGGQRGNLLGVKRLRGALVEARVRRRTRRQRTLTHRRANQRTGLRRHDHLQSNRIGPMDAAPRQLRVQREGAVGGLGLALSIVAVPIAVPILAIRYLESRSPLFGLLGLSAITAIWMAVLFLLVRVIIDLIHGAAPRAPAGGFLWLATVIVTMYSFAAPAEASNSHSRSGAGVTYVVRPGDTLWLAETSTIRAEPSDATCDNPDIRPRLARRHPSVQISCPVDTFPADIQTQEKPETIDRVTGSLIDKTME